LSINLIRKFQALYANEPNARDLDVMNIAVYSALVGLNFHICPWANWTGTEAAIKLHAALDLRGPLPTFINFAPANYGAAF
jgi:ABC-type siderophore export system fused ATPase/permease subunit